MNLDQFIEKWIGKKADWDGAYGGQCVDLFRFYNHEVLEIDQPKGVVGAADFWTNYESDPVLNRNFDKISNTPDFTPQSGDVMLWNKNAGGGFGHVAICTGENTGTQYFKSFDQNWSRVSYCEIVNHNYKNVLGVLRPKKGNMSDDSDKIQLDKQTFERLVTKSSRYDEFEKMGWTNPNEIKTVIDTLKEELERERATNAQTTREYKEAYKNLVRDLANALGSSQQPPEIMDAVRKALKAEDEWAIKDKQYKADRKEWMDNEMKLKDEIARLQARLEGEQDPNLEEILKMLIKRLRKLVIERRPV